MDFASASNGGLERARRFAGAPRGARQRGQRMNALLDAASALILEKGLKSTSVEEIAARAGFAKGTFYHYFYDRPAMLEALRQRFSQAAGEMVGASMSQCPPDDWDGRLNAWVCETVRQYLATHALHDVIFHDGAASQPWPMTQEPIVTKLVELLEEGIAAGVWASDDPMKTAIFLLTGLHGVLDEASAANEDMEKVAMWHAQLFRRTLRPE